MAQAVTLQTVPAISTEDATGRRKKLWLRLHLAEADQETQAPKKKKKIYPKPTAPGTFPTLA